MAKVIDVLFNLSPLLVGWMIMQRVGNPQTTAFHLRVWTAIGTLIIVIGQMIMVSIRGQTLGKVVMGVRIVDYRDESNPGFVNAVLLRSFTPWLIAAFPCLGALFTLADLFAIFGEEHRCIHDRMAGTKVVEV